MRLKRCFDILVSLAFVCTAFPFLYILIGMAVKLTSAGPVLFKQRRSGLDNRTFTCLKFRTMVVNDQADTLQAASNDRRITRVGQFLRATSLDELPQFINVLRGDMSIVGPRPHMLYHTSMYASAIPDYMRRLSVKPGITGVAQILGYRGETPELADMKRRVRLDLWYVDHQSFKLDLHIFIYTLFDFLKKKQMIKQYANENKIDNPRNPVPAGMR